MLAPDLNQQGATCWTRPAGVFQALQEVVSAVRNARAEYGVELGRKIPAQLIVAEAGLSSALQTEMPVLCSLAKLDEAQVNHSLDLLRCCWARHQAQAAAKSCGDALLFLSHKIPSCAGDEHCMWCQL